MKKSIAFALFVIFYNLLTAQIKAGDLVIIEIMNNPKAVSDVNGEWFKVYNKTSDSINLKGYKIKDNGSNNHTIKTDVIIAPKSYFLFARKADSTLNGGINPDYSFSFSLGNSDDEIIILSPNDSIIDEVYYDESNGFPDSDGASLVLDIDIENTNSGHIFNDGNANWKLETVNTYGAGDYGTPHQTQNNIITSLWSTETNNKKFTIAPTLITDQQFTIISNENKVLEYSLFSIDGRFIKNDIINTNQTTALRLPKGNYVITIDGETEKIIVK